MVISDCVHAPFVRYAERGNWIDMLCQNVNRMRFQQGGRGGGGFFAVVPVVRMAYIDGRFRVGLSYSDNKGIQLADGLRGEEGENIADCVGFRLPSRDKPGEVADLIGPAQTGGEIFCRRRAGDVQKIDFRIRFGQFHKPGIKEIAVADNHAAAVGDHLFRFGQEIAVRRNSVLIDQGKALCFRRRRHCLILGLAVSLIFHTAIEQHSDFADGAGSALCLTGADKIRADGDQAQRRAERDPNGLFHSAASSTS